MDSKLPLVVYLTALLLFAGGCDAASCGPDPSANVYTREVSESTPRLPVGASAEAAIAATGDATRLLAHNPELAQAVLDELPRCVGEHGGLGNHLTVVANIIGGRETEIGAELYVDGFLHWWSLTDGQLDYGTAGELIGRMRFESSSGRIQLVAWDQPLDGEALVPGIEVLFPKPYSDQAIRRLSNKPDLRQLGEELGERWADRQSE